MYTIQNRDAWTDDRLALLKKLWGEGLSGGQIAARIGGVTRNAVIAKANRLGLPPRRDRNQITKAQHRVKRETGKPSFNFGHQTSRPTSARYLKEDDRPLRQALHIPEGERKTLEDLDHTHCRWPFSEEGKPTTYCGRTRHLGLSYCTQHALVAFTSSRAHNAVKANPLYEHAPKETEDFAGVRENLAELETAP